MIRTLSLLVLVLVLAAGAAAYLLKDKTYTLKFTEPQLRERIDNQLPFTETYLFIFTVTLDNPRVDLVEGSDRVAGGLDVVLNITMGGEERPLGGAVDVSGGVRYEAAQGEFFLTDPRIENVRIQRLPKSITNRANSALSLALGEFYRERPIYRLSETDVRQSAAKMVLQDVVVKDETLHVTLGLGDKAAE